MICIHDGRFVVASSWLLLLVVVVVRLFFILFLVGLRFFHWRQHSRIFPTGSYVAGCRRGTLGTADGHNLAITKSHICAKSTRPTSCILVHTAIFKYVLIHLNTIIAQSSEHHNNRSGFTVHTTASIEIFHSAWNYKCSHKGNYDFQTSEKKGLLQRSASFQHFLSIVIFDGDSLCSPS